jgi:hypothetical protein
MVKSFTEPKSTVSSGPSSYEVPAFVCSILGVIVPVFGLILAILATIFAAMQRKRAPTSMATASLVLGIVGIVLQLLITTYVILVIRAMMSVPTY